MSAPERIAVIGLGYVGLPLTIALAKAHPEVIGFDTSERRVVELMAGRDSTGEVAADALARSSLRFTADPGDLAGCTFFSITVPTPVDRTNRPDLSAVRRACEIVGGAMAKGAVVVLESTVYPGVTEDFCAPILAAVSGHEAGRDFHLGYSPERINPGDAEHSLERVVKVIAADSDATLERVTNVYRPVATGGLHVAPSITVAETAKIIENVQRDLNIALMNEVAIICDRLGIATRDVLAAAETKWNFLPFRPGLVGGHCVSVDPYYLTTRAELAGYHPHVILAGRRINDSMGTFIARRTVTLMLQAGFAPPAARVGILGVTFKENVRDIRNSRVPDIVAELGRFGFAARVFDPLAETADVAGSFGFAVDALPGADDLAGIDALVLAVPHREFLDALYDRILPALRPGAIVIDVKSAIDRARLPEGLVYWSL